MSSFGMEIEIANVSMILDFSHYEIYKGNALIQRLNHSVQMGPTKKSETASSKELVRFLASNIRDPDYKNFLESKYETILQNTADKIDLLSELGLYGKDIKILNPIIFNDFWVTRDFDDITRGNNLAEILLKNVKFSADRYGGVTVPEIITHPIGRYKGASDFSMHPKYLEIVWRFAFYIAERDYDNNIKIRMLEPALSDGEYQIFYYGCMQIKRNREVNLLLNIQYTLVINLTWFSILPPGQHDYLVSLLDWSVDYRTDELGLLHAHHSTIFTFDLECTILFFAREMVRYLHSKISPEHYRDIHNLNWIHGAFGLIIYFIYVLCAGGRKSTINLYKNLFVLFPKTNVRVAAVMTFLNSPQYYQAFVDKFKEFMFGQLGNEEREIEINLLASLTKIFPDSDDDSWHKKISCLNILREHSANKTRIRTRLEVQSERKVGENIMVDPNALIFALFLSALPKNGAYYFANNPFPPLFDIERLRRTIFFIMEYSVSRLGVSAGGPGKGQLKFELRQSAWKNSNHTGPSSKEIEKIRNILMRLGEPVVKPPTARSGDRAGKSHVDTIHTPSELSDSDADTERAAGRAWVPGGQYPMEVGERRPKGGPTFPNLDWPPKPKEPPKEKK